jgi:hypothetical protein
MNDRVFGADRGAVAASDAILLTLRLDGAFFHEEDMGGTGIDARLAENAARFIYGYTIHSRSSCFVRVVPESDRRR